MARANEEQFNELHGLVTNELIGRIKSGTATTQDIKAAADWLAKNISRAFLSSVLHLPTYLTV